MKMDSGIKEQHQYITELLYKKRVNEAITELRDFLVETGAWEFHSKLEQIETSYKYMLEYMRQNLEDPERRQLHYRILTDLISIVDQAHLLHEEKLSLRSYFKVRKQLKSSEQQHTLESITLELEAYTENSAMAGLLKNKETTKVLKEAQKRRELMQSTLFQMIWVNSNWSSEELASARKMLDSVLIPTNDLCLLVSAVTLSILECFDLRKLLFLLDAYEHQENTINQRALVGIAIIIQIFHKRLLYYPEVKARLSLLNESDEFGQNLNRVQIQLLRTKETEKINKRMRDEIIPEMIKSANIHQTRIRPEESDEDVNEYNPDWGKEIEDSPLGDKLREMSELQMEGADVYMSTFSQLKQYPFFKTMSNWFYPFDRQHSSVVEEMGSGGSVFLNLILESGFFCDSDKYSLCFTIMHIPGPQRDAMISQLSEQQLEELMDEQKSASMKQFVGKPEVISNLYLHNLYRFYKLYARRHEFRDIFAEPIYFNTYEIVKPILQKPDLLQNLADFCLHKEHFTEAIETYNSLLEFNRDEAEYHQKLGYCYQKLKLHKQAIKEYLKADMIKPDNVWTNRRLATCHRMLQDYVKAVEYYRKAEQVQPENRSLLFNTGSCLTELERYDEALQYFFKLDFIEPDSLRAWRAIAWCSFISGKLEQAKKYNIKIIEKHGVAPDYLNAGHVAWCLGDMKTAIELYAKSCKLAGNKALFLDVFYKDREYLLKNGINEDDISLMYDLI